MLQLVKCLIKIRKKMGLLMKYGHNIFLRYESLLDIVSTNTSLQCTILKVLMAFQMKTTTFPPLQMFLCFERDKIRLKKNSCCPTWLGPASIAAVSWLQLVLRAQGTNISILSTETSCPDTFSWFSLVTSHKDKKSA